MSLLRRNKYGYKTNDASAMLWKNMLVAWRMNWFECSHAEDVLADVLKQVDKKLKTK